MTASPSSEHEGPFSEPTDVGPAVGGDLPSTDTDIELVVRVLDAAHDEGRLTRTEHAERLSDARQATILDDLTVLTRDLVATSPVTGTEVPRWPSSPKADLEPAETTISTIMGDIKRQGQWRIGAHTKIKSIMGDVLLDLTEATFDSQRVEVELMTVLGDVTVRVPNGVRVTDASHKVMSDSTTKLEGEPDATMPEVVITGTAIMSDVKTTGPKLSRRDKKLRRQQRKELH
ncbi:DUF1707 SHOCT-like domain-containing protein [Propionibacteriaceae bacterium Y1700]|uniref:DUF1707 SHOCT-like domain-containing protein n=1 Tax=Microlunatus sp. Y1700 TaxID=3418487 RepID=UPI003DA785A2